MTLPHDDRSTEPRTGLAVDTPPPAPPGAPPRASYWGEPEPTQRPASSTAVVVAGALLLVGGLLTLLVAFGVFASRAALNDVDPNQLPVTGQGVSPEEMLRMVRSVLAVLGPVMLVLGVVQLLGALGTFMRRGWGRLLGILGSLPGFLLGLLFLLGAVAALGQASQGAAGALIMGLVLAVVYGFCIVALARGGSHFARAAR